MAQDPPDDADNGFQRISDGPQITSEAFFDNDRLGLDDVHGSIQDTIKSLLDGPRTTATQPR